MASPKKGGRPTIFGSREGGRTVHGRLTKGGTARFEQARRALARLSGWEVEQVSDSDTIEFVQMGEAAARTHLAKHPPPPPPQK